MRVADCEEPGVALRLVELSVRATGNVTVSVWGSAALLAKRPVGTKVAVIA